MDPGADAALGAAADVRSQREAVKPRPAYQSADCPYVQLISIPGTWESSRALDPLNPTPSFPIALLLNVSNPLGQRFGADRLAQYTVPYTAQFHNPLAADNQMSYNDSREEGKKKAVEAITDINNRCPLTSFVIIGFSQGAGDRRRHRQ